MQCAKCKSNEIKCAIVDAALLFHIKYSVGIHQFYALSLNVKHTETKDMPNDECLLYTVQCTIVHVQTWKWYSE